ncbi:MAG: DUF1772 domain-containing protein [Leptolyngbya sp.]|nr:DUF1772 domain-containing protein [Candidatus Melainabacteria bacterium]
MVGNEFAVAVFFHPKISSLNDETHVRAAQSLASALGAAMPAWYALTLILSLALAFILRGNSPAGTLALIASALFVVSIIFTVLLLVPINNKIVKWDLDSLPGEWQQLRQRWDRLHVFRVVILFVAFILLVLAALTN